MFVSKSHSPLETIYAGSVRIEAMVLEIYAFLKFDILKASYDFQIKDHVIKI